VRSAGVFFGAQQLFIRSLGDPPQVSDGVRCISRQLGLHSTAVGVLPASAPPRLPPPVRPPPLPCSSGHAALSTRRRRCTTSWWTCLSATTRLNRSEDLPEPERRSFFAALSLPLFFPAVCHLWISSLMLPRLTTQSYLCRYAVTHPSTRQRWRPTASSSACPPPLPPVQRMRLREWAAAAGCSWSALDQRTRHANTRGKKKLVRAAGRLRARSVGRADSNVHQMHAADAAHGNTPCTLPASCIICGMPSSRARPGEHSIRSDCCSLPRTRGATCGSTASWMLTVISSVRLALQSLHVTSHAAQPRPPLSRPPCCRLHRARIHSLRELPDLVHAPPHAGRRRRPRHEPAALDLRPGRAVSPPLDCAALQNAAVLGRARWALMTRCFLRRSISVLLRLTRPPPRPLQCPRTRRLSTSCR
jgi:hypothetical protein